MKRLCKILLALTIALGITGLAVASALTTDPVSGSHAANIAIQPATISSPVPNTPRTGSAHREIVVFAGGCFWGVQGVFQHVTGVQRAVSGYIGGDARTARYYVVATGATAHAEAVQVTFDPSQVSYAKLLQVFFSVVHDPTQLDRQGPDHGRQYRSAVFTTTPVQLSATRSYIAQLDKSGVFESPIVTQVEFGKQFYPAEDYHQNYMTLHPNDAYIRFNDLPKVAALKRIYPAIYRPDPVLVAMH